MYAKVITLISVLCPLPFSILLAQDPDSSATFAAKPLQSGQPRLSTGLRVQLDLNDPHYAEISAGELAPSVFFTTWKTDEGKRDYGLVIENRRDGFALDRTILLHNHPDGPLTDTVDVNFDGSTSPLELRLLVESNMLLYRWINLSGHATSPSGKPKRQEGSATIQVGTSMPDFTVETLTGEAISMRELQGKYVVVNWWTTSCPPCIAEIPGLNRLVKKYKDRDDIIFLAIASNTKEELEHFFREEIFLYKQTVKSERAVDILGEVFPRHVIINPKGNIAYNKLGGAKDRYQEIDAAIQKYIR